MGNNTEIDFSSYGCSCIEKEEGCFLDFLSDIKNKTRPILNEIKDISDSKDTTSNKKTSSNNEKKYVYEKITISPKDDTNSNLNINELSKKNNKNHIIENENENNDYYLREFEYSDSEFSDININTNNDESNPSIEDINNFNSNTDYFQLANQIAKAINELNNEIPNSENFLQIIKNAGNTADKICFNDVIGCIRKISDISSDISLINEKIYLGIVNKFKTKNNEKYFINFNDEEKIVKIPNYNKIKPNVKLKLGNKYNNPKFKFNKFIIKGSFPYEILIWKLISENVEKMTEIKNDNYYCCITLLHQIHIEKENEIIMYLINKVVSD